MATPIEKIEKYLEETDTGVIQICKKHGEGALVLYDRITTGNCCPVCDEVERVNNELDQCSENEQDAINEADEAKEREAAATKRALELSERISYLEEQLEHEKEIRDNE